VYLAAEENMILAFDVYYTGDEARAVCLAFRHWTDTDAAQNWIEYISGISDYEPGAFYKRELPCILAILKTIDLSLVQAIVIDGYVVLDNNGKPGLGLHLYNALGSRIPIIGVAKTTYAGNDLNVAEVFRGKSERPLYVTAVGISLPDAAAHIQSMAGEYRMPTLLKQLDSLTRSS
jgi:deoxyinosine 3'endonuclease (endonuclease V)